MSNEEKYYEIRNDLNILKDRLNDQNLYLGVVGSFSSGKSTFINSIIHKKLLPSNAIQGTTVAVSIIEKSDYDDLRIDYIDGTFELYSANAEDLLEKYRIESQNDVENTEDKSIITKNKIASFFKKWFKRIVKWFGQIASLFFKKSNNDSNNETCSTVNTQKTMIELFKKVIATEELAENIKSVTLYYKNDHIPYNIAIVDTPGTESLNQRHNEVTKSAIDNICDAIVITIPQDKPAAQDLIEYIQENLSDHINDCIFAVTKIELLDEDEDLNAFIEYIKKVLEKKLSIKSACVIPMPTLIYLKSVDSETKISISDINNMSDERCSELIKIYEDGIDIIKKIMLERKNAYIKKRILDLCERIRAKLTSNLTDVADDFSERIQLLQQDKVKPLYDFETYAISKINEFENLLETRSKSKTDFVKIQFAALKSDIDNEINGCTDSKNILSCLSFSCRPTLEKISELYDDYLNMIEKDCYEKLSEIETDYYNQYRKCDIHGNMGITPEFRSFIDEEFISECDEKLSDCLNNIVLSIQSDTTGVLKKIKSFFSNPFEKHKEMTASQLSQSVNELSQSTENRMTDELEKIYNVIIQSIKDALINMIEKDRNTIEAYIEQTNQIENNYVMAKERTQQFIDNLDRYVENIKN